MDNPSKKSNNNRELLNALFSAPTPRYKQQAEQSDEPTASVQHAKPPVKAAPVPTTYRKSKFALLPPDVQEKIIANRAAK